MDIFLTTQGMFSHVFLSPGFENDLGFSLPCTSFPENHISRKVHFKWKISIFRKIGGCWRKTKVIFGLSTKNYIQITYQMPGVYSPQTCEIRILSSHHFMNFTFSKSFKLYSQKGTLEQPIFLDNESSGIS